MKTNRTIAGFAILVAALLATTFDPGQARAGELNHEQQQTILHEANTLYESGTANATDRALSKEAFEAAAAKYQTLVDDGVQRVLAKRCFGASHRQLRTGGGDDRR